ncbi:MAG: nicotinate (nicotinamide) nucleotide adenylyltransferase [Bacteroidales bacterium]|nr:nicotinate (nicotinamide) nucleotide adenylyltransferase [Bacteroidales bacterium]
MCLFRRKKRKPLVALLFGSFNPIHEGHLAILRYLLDHTAAAEVRLVVSPQSPFKQGQGLVDNAEARLAGAREAVSATGLAVTVSDVEFHLPEPWYTIDTLHFLQEQEPDKEFVLVMGGDNIASLERWHKGDEILRDFAIWVYPRPGYDAAPDVDRLNANPAFKGVTLFADAPQNAISSTEIRNKKRSTS